MDTRRRMIAMVTMIVGVIILVLLSIGLLLNRSGVVSPLPEDTAIKIIFITPTPTP